MLRGGRLPTLSASCSGSRPRRHNRARDQPLGLGPPSSRRTRCAGTTCARRAASRASHTLHLPRPWRAERSTIRSRTRSRDGAVSWPKPGLAISLPTRLTSLVVSLCRQAFRRKELADARGKSNERSSQEFEGEDRVQLSGSDLPSSPNDLR